jgi:hypothetical protein
MTKGVKYLMGILGVWILLGIIFLIISFKGYFNKQDDSIISEPDPLKAAIDSVYTELKAYNWIKPDYYKEDEKKYIYHDIIFTKDTSFHPMMLHDRKLIIIAYTYPTGFCHVCAGFLSLFEFDRTDGKWVLKRKSIAYSRGDEWGVPPRGLEIISLGFNDYAILDHTGYASGGHETEFKTIYTFVGDEVKEVFSFRSFENGFNQEKSLYYGTESEIKPCESTSDYTFIQFTSRGTDSEGNEIDENKTFCLKDSAYVEIADWNKKE